MKTILNRLGSIKLTITTLLLLSVTAAFGTFLPRSQDLAAWQNMVGDTGAKTANVLGLTDFYHSVWFIAFLALIAINLIACTANRLPGIVSSLSGRAALGGGVALDLPEKLDLEKRLIEVLRSMGFRQRKRSEDKIFSRGAGGYLFAVLTHGSLLVVMGFSLLGSAAGFIATKRIHVGESTQTAFNWKEKADRQLPFIIFSDDLSLVPNPVAVRLEVLELGTKRRIKEITTYEGSSFKVPGIEGRLTFDSFEVDRKDFHASWIAPDGARTGFSRDQEIGETGYMIALLAYATWPERQVHAGVTLTKGGSVIHSGEISVNHPISVDGVRIFLTDYGQDRFGFPYVGFQFVRDPGQIGVWAGCILFLVGVTGAVLIRPGCVVLVRSDSRLKVYVSSKGDRNVIIGQLCDKLAESDNIEDGG